VTNTEGTSPVEEEVPAVVAVGRTIGGILLVIVGIVLGLAGAFWYFIVPWFSWTTEGFWFVMGEWADLGGVVLGILGILALIVGGALVQRARKKRLQIFMDAEDIAALQTATGTEKVAPEKPTTIL
jgi:membrane-bound ClpP family serine protease